MFESEMGKRLWHAGEGITFGIIFAGIYWLLGLIIKVITGKEIRNGTGYTVAVVLGFISRRVLITNLSN